MRPHACALTLVRAHAHMRPHACALTLVRAHTCIDAHARKLRARADPSGSHAPARAGLRSLEPPDSAGSGWRLCVAPGAPLRCTEALNNLGVIYKDRDNFHQAIQCGRAE